MRDAPTIFAIREAICHAKKRECYPNPAPELRIYMHPATKRKLLDYILTQRPFVTPTGLPYGFDGRMRDFFIDGLRVVSDRKCPPGAVYVMSKAAREIQRRLSSLSTAEMGAFFGIPGRKP